MFQLEQVYDALKGRDEFVTKELKDTICFDYIVIKDDSFNDPVHGWIRRNLRGVTFCKHTGNLLSLPFHKFYNINQNEESQFINHKNKRASIYEKVDGSMIHFYRKTDGELVASTCRSPETLQAQQALAFALNDVKLLNFITESIDNNLTPMFEWCAPHNQIVVQYDQPRLVYLMSRFKDNGNYLFETKYEDRVQKYDFKFSDVVLNNNKTNFEGYVCYLEDGNVFKVKTSWYMERHRCVDLLAKPKYKIYECALDGIIDDVISTSPVGHQRIFMDIDSEVKNDLLAERLKLEEEFESLIGRFSDAGVDFRKNFALEAKKSPNFSGLMLIFGGKSPDSVLKKNLLKRYVDKYPMKVLT